MPVRPRPSGFRSAFLCALCFLSGSAFPLFAQDAASEPADTAAAPVPAVQDAPGFDADAMELDIRTSSLLELAAWCRELGLPENGTREDLSKRLREYFKLGSRLVLPGAGSIAGKSSAADRAVVVESAQSSEYFTVEVVDEEYARLRGGVVVSFKDKDATHRIKAREILYNRTRNSIAAKGDVEYEKKSGDSEEFFRGQSLTVDIDNWTGVFLDGVSEKSKSGDDTAYRFSADVISRAPEGVTVLDEATVTTASDSEPYWSMDAKRIWLLPGSEWAVSGALLKVGEIPVLYFPFFYFPGDDLVFHPVLGYREREGAYFQTTTYLFGRPKKTASTEKSIMTMLQGDSDEERRREGLFLRRTGKRAASEDGARLSVLMDAYANLGYYLGLNAYAPKRGALSKAEASLGIAFSRAVYYDSSNDYYSPFTDFSTNESYPEGNWDSSRLFSAPVPFRYRFLSTGSLSGALGTLAWNAPFYSDPYIDQDFLDRSEDMDWMNLIKQGSTTDAESDVDVLGSYEVSLSGTLTPNVKNLNPWINTLSLTTMKSSLAMKTKTDSTLSYPSIDRIFFYPQKLTLFSLSGSVAGTVLGGSSSSAAKPASVAGAVQPADAPTVAPDLGVPRAPWEEKSSDGGGKAEKGGAEAFSPPALTQTFSASKKSASSALQVGYTMTPSVSSDVVFNTDAWDAASDIEWDDIASVLFAAKNTGKISASASLPNDALSASLALNANAAWQSNAYINEESSSYNTEALREAAVERNYSSTYLKTTGELTLSSKPFAQDPVWSATTLGYTLKGSVFDTTFDGTYAAPHWSADFGEWNSTSVSAHEASVGIAALVRDLSQSLKLSASIYPRPSELSASSVVRVWRTTTSASASVVELEDGGTFKPVTITETIDLGNSRSFAQSVVFDPEADEPEFTALSSALSYGAFTASFAAKNAVGYDLDEDSGWYVSDTSLKLRAQTLSLAYKKAQTVPPLWKNRVNFNFSVNSSFSFDFQRYTQSYLSFALSSTVKVNQFLDLTFSSTSKNSVMFRYFQDLPFFDLPLEIPGEKNPIVDLLDSFNFFDDSKRRSSGFKLKSFSLSAKHYLGDWTAELTYGLTPYLDKTTSPYVYKFETEISFLVKWTPVPELKAETSYSNDGFAIE